MKRHLIAYVDSKNFWLRLMGQPARTVETLTAADVDALLDCLASDLSPENLCCDGELSGAPLRRKAAMLNGAKAELLKLQRQLS